MSELGPVDGEVQVAEGAQGATGNAPLGVVDAIALALSGGGYRATLFHLGAIWRLNEMGYLKRIERISSVSGGSILAGFLGLRWRELDFDANGVATNFESVIVDPVTRFCGRSIDVAAFFIGWLVPGIRPSDALAFFYRGGLFGKATLQDLPADDNGPRFVLNATGLQTCADVRFSRTYIGDYKVGLYLKPTTSLALAVAASSGFPPVFSPVVVKPEGGTWDPNVSGEAGADLDKLRERMILSDGGVYDNIGLQTISKYKIVLASDASAPQPIEPDGAGALGSVVSGGLRVVLIMLGQIQSRRKVELIAQAKAGAALGVKRALWDIATKIDDYKVPAMVADNALTDSLQTMRTRLNRFTPEEQGRLINWGYALADASMRRWIAPAQPVPKHWPVPDYPLN